MAGLQELQDGGDGITAVDDILHQKHIPVEDIFFEIQSDPHLACRFTGANAVGGYGHEINRVWHSDTAHEISQEEHAAAQDADHVKMPPLVITADLLPQLMDALFQHIFGD